MELTKQALFNVATERFKSWSKMYADPDVTPEYMYEDMCASCFSGELAFDWEDRYIYKDGGCSFKHKGVEFLVASLRDMRPDESLGKERYFDVCVCVCDHKDEDGLFMYHFLSTEAWLYGSGSDEFEEGKVVDARFINEADKYINKIGREKLIELQKKED